MDKKITLSFGKDKTAIIKGIAIIFMIMLHCGKPDWYVVDIPAFSQYPWLYSWLDMGKLCVGIFAFMVGYGYAYSKNKDLAYSWAHINKLLIPFWVVLLIFTYPVMALEGNLGGSKMIVLNLFGINSDYCWVSWFVAFFIYAMAVLPFMSRIINRWPLVGTFALIVTTYLIEVAVHTIPGWSANDWTQRIFDCMINSPKMLIGYLFAYKGWFTKVVIPHHWIMVPVSLLLMIIVFVCRFYIGTVAGFNLDSIYAPLFIFAVLIIFNLYRLPILSNALAMFGNTSVYMWFIHSLFFTESVRSIYQPLIIITDKLWLIMPWTILLSFLISWLVQKGVTFVQSIISR